jgi:dipeptidyl-peptidase 4
MPGTPEALDEFPRQIARTRGFSLGAPRSFTISPDGQRIAFLRTRGGDDPASSLWVFDVATAAERLVFDPQGDEEEAELTDAERVRRERARERSTGVTSYATDRDVRRAVFSVSGQLHLADLVDGSARQLTSPGAVDDPRLDDGGERIAYVVDGALHVREIEGGNRVLAADDDPEVSWGLAEFVAAEEMHRFRGHWFSPDGAAIAAARVDERQLPVWFIGDATDPRIEPRAVRYPATGTVNAIVTLHLFDVASGERTDVAWDRDAFEYLARFEWTSPGPPLILVQSRDQRTVQLLEIDVETGATSLVRERTDPDWVDLAEDAPRRLAGGRIVEVVADRESDTYRLTVDDAFITPPGLQVREVLEVGEGILFRASDEPTEIHLYRWTEAEGPIRLSEEPGVHSGTAAGGVTVLSSATPQRPGATVSVRKHGASVGEIISVAETPVIEPRPTFVSLGEREMRAAIFWPNGEEPDHALPVLLDPYGGPHGPRVLKAASAHLTSQWFADQGFVVLVIDNRGTPGRGPAWDREMRDAFDLALVDQVDGLHAAAEMFSGRLDLGRVAMRGWSFGGELSAMAAIHRPDVFTAAVIGAPVTDQHLYDTHYTERYIGTPDANAEVYARNSPLTDAAKLEIPILLIHGLADDNVYVAHSLKFSAALFEAGRFHELVLIPNATHLTRSTAVTENILRVQLDFLKRHLDV